MLSDPFSSAAADVLITQAPDFVGIFDVAQSWFIRINPAGVRLLGYPSEQAFLSEYRTDGVSGSWRGVSTGSYQ
jgi:PAS domain-containing protein